MDTPLNPLILPRLHPAIAQLQNALCLRKFPQAVPLSRHMVSIFPCRIPAAFDAQITIEFSINGVRWQLAFNDTAWIRSHSLFDDAALENTALSELPQELLAAIAESLLTPVTKQLSLKLNSQILIENVFVSLPDRPNWVCAFGIELNDPAHSVFYAALSPKKTSEASVLAELIAQIPRQSNGALLHLLDDIPLHLIFSAGELTLTTDEYNSIEVGDFLLPQNWLPAGNELLGVLLSGDQPLAQLHCQFQNQQAQIVSPVQFMTENTMDTADTLNVTLSFDLEERTITLGDLKSLDIGYVFTLTSNPQAPVTIRANGKPVARARLVDLNGTIGVQITESL